MSSRPEPVIFGTKTRLPRANAASRSGGVAAGCYTVALPDPRMVGNESKFTSLKPTWLLPNGIGSFPLDSIRKVAPSHRGTISAAAPTLGGISYRRQELGVERK